MIRLGATQRHRPAAGPATAFPGRLACPAPWRLVSALAFATAGFAALIPASPAPAAEGDAPALSARPAATESLPAVAGRALRQREQDRLEIAADLDRIAALRSELAVRIDRNHKATARLLRALRRLNRTAPALVLAASDTPLAGVRTGIVLDAAVSALSGRWRDLRGDYASLHAAGELARTRRDDLGRLIAADDDSRHRVGARADESRDGRAGFVPGRKPHTGSAGPPGGGERQPAGIASRPQDPAEALAGIIAAPSRPPARRTMRAAGGDPGPDRPPAPGPAANAAPEARASLSPGPRMLVAGTLLTGFGAPLSHPLAVGGRSQGVRYRTGPGAVVVAPAAGDVAFAGRFRDYGLLLIVEHGDRYHSLLAGLGQAHVAAGDRVTAGDPVGVMTAREDRHRILYYELRLDGRPVNPLPWLTADTKEVDE